MLRLLIMSGGKLCSSCLQFKDKIDPFCPDLKDTFKIFPLIQNHSIDFTPPRITEKPPMFGVDKWMEEQNNKLASPFNTDIHRLETLYRNDAQQQIEFFKQNAMADYKEHWALRDENQELSKDNQFLKEEINNVFDKLTDPETRDKIFTLADALMGGKPVITSGGGGDPTPISVGTVADPTKKRKRIDDDAC